MKKILDNQVPFPIDAESDNFTASLASALVITKGYTEDTPYWCVPNRRYCIHCSPCGDNICWNALHMPCFMMSMLSLKV